jgi:hypothetical protein
MVRGSSHHPRSWVVEDAAFSGVVFSRDADGRLLVQPPAGESEVIGNSLSFLKNDAMWDKRGVVSQSHGSATDDKYVRGYTAADVTLTQSGESAFGLCSAREDAIGACHAASRSLADMYTPCFRNAAGAQTSASTR